MGHHAVYCAITKTPITGGRCVAIFSKERKNKNPYNQNFINSIPYRGVYDTYGRLEFDTPPKYLEHLSEEEIEFPDVFIDEDVYDELITFSSGRYGDGISDGSVFSNGDISAKVLLTLGFIELAKKPKDKRYNRIFVHPWAQENAIHSDGRWSRVYVDGKEVKDVYHFEDMEKYFPDVDFSVIKNKAIETEWLEEAYEAGMVYKKIFAGSGISIDEGTRKILNDSVSRAAEDIGICHELFNYSTEKGFFEELGKSLRIVRFMTSNNIEFGNGYKAGPQDGNYYMHAKLVHFMNLVDAKNKKELAEMEMERD